MILKFHRFSNCGGGEESVILPVPKELEEDVKQGDFDIECLSSDSEVAVSYWDAYARCGGGGPSVRNLYADGSG